MSDTRIKHQAVKTEIPILMFTSSTRRERVGLRAGMLWDKNMH